MPRARGIRAHGVPRTHLPTQEQRVWGVDQEVWKNPVSWGRVRRGARWGRKLQARQVTTCTGRLPHPGILRAGERHQDALGEPLPATRCEAATHPGHDTNPHHGPAREERPLIENSVSTCLHHHHHANRGITLKCDWK